MKIINFDEIISSTYSAGYVKSKRIIPFKFNARICYEDDLYSFYSSPMVNSYKDANFIYLVFDLLKDVEKRLKYVILDFGGKCIRCNLNYNVYQDSVHVQIPINLMVQNGVK